MPLQEVGADRRVSQLWGGLQPWPLGVPILTPQPREALTVPGAGLASSGAAFLARQAGVQAARASAFSTQKSSSTARPCVSKGQCGVNKRLPEVSERAEMSHRSEEGQQGVGQASYKSLWVSKGGHQSLQVSVRE